MVAQKESGLWKNYVIGALVVALLVVLFYSPGVLMSPESDACEAMRAAAQADIDAAQTELDVKEGELSYITGVMMDKVNVVLALQTSSGEIDSEITSLDLQIADINAQIRSLVGTDTNISDLVTQRGSLSDQKAGKQNEKRTIERAIRLESNILMDLIAQVNAAQEARDAAQVDLNYAIDALENLPPCPSEPCYVPEPTPDTDTP